MTVCSGVFFFSSSSLYIWDTLAEGPTLLISKPQQRDQKAHIPRFKVCQHQSSQDAAQSCTYRGFFTPRCLPTIPWERITFWAWQYDASEGTELRSCWTVVLWVSVRKKMFHLLLERNSTSWINRDVFFFFLFFLNQFLTTHCETCARHVFVLFMFGLGCRAAQHTPPRPLGTIPDS